MNSLASTPDLQRDLKSVASDIRTDDSSFQTYGKDWLKHFQPKPLAIAFPKSVDELQKLIIWANRNHVAVVPSGGRTGLSGGAVALNKELVISTENMREIRDFNLMDRTVVAQAGVVTEQLQNFVHDKGYFFPVDFASRGSSQIGGNIATNAGGIKVLRYGCIRDWVAGLKVVTGDGRILDFNNGLVKNATGFDFRHLWIGSEGVLGMVAEATLRFTTQPKPLQVVLMQTTDLPSIMKIFTFCRDRLPLSAFEFFSDVALKHVVHMGKYGNPFAQTAPNFILLEYEQLDTSTAELASSVVEELAEKGWIQDALFSQSDAQAKHFWALREDISEATSPYAPYKNDISVTIAKVPEFLQKVDEILKREYPQFEVVWFGHIGDGNLHINILKPESMAKDEFLKHCVRVNDLLFSAIQKFGGSISAEHGVGLVKKPYLQFSRSPDEIDAMRAIKKIFDPNGIMNPGKIF